MNDVNISKGVLPLEQGSAASSATKSARSSAEAGTNQGAAKPAEEQAKERVENGQKGVEAAVTKLNDYVQNVQRDLQFQLDNDSGKTVITVVDSQTSEVVRQIPDDVALKLAQDLQQDEPLSLFRAKV